MENAVQASGLRAIELPSHLDLALFNTSRKKSVQLGQKRCMCMDCCGRLNGLWWKKVTIRLAKEDQKAVF